MIQILVTGGAGFVGSAISEKLLSRPDVNLVIVDNLTTGAIEKLPENHRDRYKFIKCDVNNYRDIAEVFSAFHFDYVFHYAAMVGVQRTQKNPVQVLCDLHGIEFILNLSKNSNVKRVFFSSSSEVYGEPVEFPQNEMTTPLNSKLPYAIVKNAGEAFLKSYHKEFGLNYTIFRFFNTYGPKQSRDFVISRFIGLALRNEPITVYGDGSQTRTFCFVEDNIDATYNCFEKSLEDPNKGNNIYNIGNDNETSILELASKIIQLTKSKSVIKHLPALKDGDMTRRLPDISNMKTLLNRDLLKLEDGIQRILSNTTFIL